MSSELLENSERRWEELPGRLVVLSGASGSGKSTIVDRLLSREKLPVARSISATTRDPRLGEIPGETYFFETREQFEHDRDEDRFLEWAEVHGHLYGTPVGPIKEKLAQGLDLILVIDVQGGMKVREKVPNAVLIFVQTPSFEVLEARLRARATDDEPSILRRLANARREIALSDRYDFQIINDDLESAVDDLAAILAQHRSGG